MGKKAKENESAQPNEEPRTQEVEQFEKFMTVKEAAKMVGLSDKTIYALIAEKQIPCTKIGRRRSNRPKIYLQKTDLINALKKLRVDDHPLRSQ